MKSASIKKILILVTILAVPGFLYYLLQEKGKNRYKPLPYFGPKEVAQTFHSVRGQQIPDTIYHEVKNFDWINQQGNTISWDSYKGKILIVGLFYTQGNTRAVNFANKAMRAFDATYAANKIVNFVSMSIDPSFDRPEVLAKYAHMLNAQAGKWDLLTGDSTGVFQFINGQLFIDAHQGVDPETKLKTFSYSNMFVLLDPQHRIRGYYEATNQEALSKLDDEIKVLIAEVLRNTEDGR
ncbi:MAG TPA: SCO family protein [Pedobacter sp.]|nr:SCO family protein [Pedobacter sp.]